MSTPTPESESPANIDPLITKTELIQGHLKQFITGVLAQLDELPSPHAPCDDSNALAVETLDKIAKISELCTIKTDLISGVALRPPNPATIVSIASSTKRSVNTVKARNPSSSTPRNTVKSPF